jgi:hypothetical protein
MKLPSGSVIAMALRVTSCAAHGAYIWTCTYPDLATGKPYIADFRVVGDELLEDDLFQLRFKILQDTAYGLVAVWSIAGMEKDFPSKKTPTIGAITMVINKKTGELLRSFTWFDVPEKANSAIHGTCQLG